MSILGGYRIVNHLGDYALNFRVLFLNPHPFWIDHNDLINNHSIFNYICMYYLKNYYYMILIYLSTSPVIDKWRIVR